MSSDGICRWHCRAIVVVGLSALAACGSPDQRGVGGTGPGGGEGGDRGGTGGSGSVSAGGTTNDVGGSIAMGMAGESAGNGSPPGAGGSGVGGSTGVGGGAAGAGGGVMHMSACSGGQSSAGDVAVNLAETHQKISGFGASTAWGSTMSNADADTLWSTTTGAGLSLHRIRIDYQTGHTSEVNIAKLAVAHGVTVWATPWTPPSSDKSGASGAHGEVEGTLSNGQAFGTFLAGFITYMKSQGVDIYAVSAQNEPDANVTYESCKYTGPTMASFVGTYMGPALANSAVKIMAPETQNWCGFPSFESAILNDANASKYTSIIATHEYGCSPKAYPEIQAAGKEFWETEIYDTTTNTADPGMPSALRVAKLIHDAMTISSMNAWHYWWVFPASADNGALWDKGTNKPTKRLWVEGNYARFVRPGFVRVGTSGAAPAGVSVSAYTNPADGTVSIVAINANAAPASLAIFVSGAAPCSFTPWVTSASDSLASRPPVAVTTGRLSISLDAQSVTTLVGKP